MAQGMQQNATAAGASVNNNNNDKDDDNDNAIACTTGGLTIEHPIMGPNLPSPEVHNNSPAPPPWATQLKAMVLPLVTDTAKSKRRITNIQHQQAAGQSHHQPLCGRLCYS